eukprot:scaffold81497_cov75-Phaeocystis_antarctica.AAC.2
MAAPQLALSSSSSALSSSSSVAGRLRRAISRTLSAGLKPVTRLPSASRAVPRCEWRAAVRTGESSESLESRFIPLAPPPPLRAVPRCGWQAAARTLAALTLAALTLAAVERARELAARAASASKSSESLESRFTPQVPPPPLRAVPRCGWQAAARTLAALTLAAVERARELAARAASASKSSESLESRFTPQAPPPPLRAVPRCWWQAAVRTGESSELLELEQEAAQAREGRVAVRRHEAVAAKAAPAAAAGLLDLSWVAAAARIGEPSESLELVVAVAPGRLVRRRGGARQAAVIAARRLELVTRLKRRSTAESEEQLPQPARRAGLGLQRACDRRRRVVGQLVVPEAKRAERGAIAQHAGQRRAAAVVQPARIEPERAQTRALQPMRQCLQAGVAQLGVATERGAELTRRLAAQADPLPLSRGSGQGRWQRRGTLWSRAGAWCHSATLAKCCTHPQLERDETVGAQVGGCPVQLWPVRRGVRRGSARGVGLIVDLFATTRTLEWWRPGSVRVTGASRGWRTTHCDAHQPRALAARQIRQHFGKGCKRRNPALEPEFRGVGIIQRATVCVMTSTLPAPRFYHLQFCATTADETAWRKLREAELISSGGEAIIRTRSCYVIRGCVTTSTSRTADWSRAWAVWT